LLLLAVAEGVVEILLNHTTEAVEEQVAIALVGTLKPLAVELQVKLGLLQPLQITLLLLVLLVPLLLLLVDKEQMGVTQFLDQLPQLAAAEVRRVLVGQLLRLQVLVRMVDQEAVVVGLILARFPLVVLVRLTKGMRVAMVRKLLLILLVVEVAQELLVLTQLMIQII
tara:strand:+ start:30 stop:533 length:504 start_codon:yes stop_codon:yes gene_type:complete